MNERLLAEIECKVLRTGAWPVDHADRVRPDPESVTGIS